MTQHPSGEDDAARAEPPQARDAGRCVAARRAIGPGLDRAVGISRRILGVAQVVLSIAVGALALVGLGVAALLAASGRLHWWLAFGLLALWLAAACYAVRRVARLGGALDSRDAFIEQFVAALDIAGAAAKAAAVFGPSTSSAADGRSAADGGSADDGRSADGGGSADGDATPGSTAAAAASSGSGRRSDRSWLRRLLRFYSLVKVPSDSLDRIRSLPLIAPLLPSSLGWTRAWLAIATALTVVCPALAIAGAAAGFGPG